ncbi:hypothetical protein BRX36_20090 [Sphingomonas sp. S-NIH.Pt1_0416]|uniref:S24 family peptidase n=1 Tax=Sphingomonas TaxID=13687 RepID=UPI000F7E6204|nr:S24 family peptidase [Sphingomonas sp. S-NIH.Pt1_0416]RSU58732.1 hypothetical protein BRX36_20090 [Sphingomonas sp. S-NIH.Pt1_0416]
MLAIADTMAGVPESLYDRLMAVKPADLSANKWTTLAGVNRNAFTDIRKRGAANHDTIERLLAAISVTFGEFEAGEIAPKHENEPRERGPFLAFRGDDRPRDIPVVGTALCADVEVDSDGRDVSVEAMELDFGEVIDHIRRPLSLDGKREIYALYFRGVSMSPRYEPGELGYVDPNRPPQLNDYVVVQLRKPDGVDGERVYTVIAKRLKRQTSAHYELEQFNPPLTFQVPREHVAHIHRIIPWDELVSF